MNFAFQLLDSSSKYKLGYPPAEMPPIRRLSVLKNEEFGVQLIIRAEEEFLTVRDLLQDISWQGLSHRLRIRLLAELSDGQAVSETFFFTHLMDFVRDDNGEWICDILTDKPSASSRRQEQAVFIGGKIPSDFSHPFICLNIQIFYTESYENESLIHTLQLPIDISEYVLPDIRQTDFYMDLWQHPCNWARIYDVPYYTDEHFQILEHYLAALSCIGQKVCDLIISDFPWAGQRCYKVHENHNNLFESNIVKIFKKTDGHFTCDFSAMDRYIRLCEKYSITKEINLFGILGNWDAYDFGNPLTDFGDPIRLSYLDLNDQTYRYMTSETEVETYLTLVFEHLDELGLWDKTLIISDEPSNVELFARSVRLFERAAKDKPVHLKCAIHDQKFFEQYGEHIKSLSLNTCELVHNAKTIHHLKEAINAKGGTLTWYSCCFPTPMNIFLKSPLIESRLIGWFTYYMGLSGFLRWAYGVWPGDVYADASYKKEKWAAGDMFFVYPGKHGKPLSSLRLKNMLYGIQDYMFLRAAEEMLGSEAIENDLAPLLGHKDRMKFIPEREIFLEHDLELSHYEQLKKELLQKMFRKEDYLKKISDSIVEMDEDHILIAIDRALANNISSDEIYEQGLSDGMLRVTKLFEEKKYFVSEVIVCADTLNKGIHYLKSKFPVSSKGGPKVVMGVVEGDLHEIGKNIVKILFEAAGFDVIDMGLNVKAQDIVQKAISERADIIGLSTMMTTTMSKMREVIDILHTCKAPTLPKVIIGGGCISEKYSKEIGADGYSANAVEAVKLVQRLTGGNSDEL